MIPQVFHVIWMQGVSLRPKDDYFRTFLESHPGWSLQIWDENSFKSRLWEYMDDKLRAFYDSLPHVVQKADVARMVILYQFGGVYTDLDFVCLNPLRSKLLNSQFFGVVEHDNIICNGIFGCIPRHPLVKVVLDEWSTGGLQPKDTSDEKQWILTTTGPHKVSDIWRKQLKVSQKTYIEEDTTEFFPFTQAESQHYNKFSLDDLKKTFPKSTAAHMYWGHW